MKKIFKYKLPRDGEVITIHADVIKWLNIQEQNGWPHIWAIVEENGKAKDYEIAAWGTGWMVPDELMLMSYLGTAQDLDGYVWHYFMREADLGYATVTVNDYQYNPYDYTLTTKGTPDLGYNITISCGDPDSAISALESKVYNDYTTSIDGLQSAVEYLTTTVANSNTATLRACT